MEREGSVSIGLRYGLHSCFAPSRKAVLLFRGAWRCTNLAVYFSLILHRYINRLLRFTPYPPQPSYSPHLLLPPNSHFHHFPIRGNPNLCWMDIRKQSPKTPNMLGSYEEIIATDMFEGQLLRLSGLCAISA
jgi:hypothetical protein